MLKYLDDELEKDIESNVMKIDQTTKDLKTKLVIDIEEYKKSVN